MRTDNFFHCDCSHESLNKVITESWKVLKFRKHWAQTLFRWMGIKKVLQQQEK